MEKNEMKILTYMSHEDNDVKAIENELSYLSKVSISRDFGGRMVSSKYSMDGAEYQKRSDKVTKAVLSYAAEKAGVKDISNKRAMAFAFDQTDFGKIVNSIVAETLNSVVLTAEAPQLFALANVDEVDIGDSKTYQIETKGLPIAQRTSYNSNYTYLNSFTTTPITIVPKPYTLGSQIDYIRVLGNGFDFGKEIARVALGLLYAQYRLVSGVLFNSANLTGTPFYNATYDAATYVKTVTYLQAVNGGSQVKAYGTLPAFNAMAATGTTNYGFAAQDEQIRNGMIGLMNGVPNIVLDQATDLSAPFTTANITSLLLIPENEVLLLSDVGDKPVKLVRENYIRVLAKDQNEGSLYNQAFSYTQSFDAQLATQAQYAIQGIA